MILSVAQRAARLAVRPSESVSILLRRPTTSQGQLVDVYARASGGKGSYFIGRLGLSNAGAMNPDENPGIAAFAWSPGAVGYEVRLVDPVSPDIDVVMVAGPPMVTPGVIVVSPNPAGQVIDTLPAAGIGSNEQVLIAKPGAICTKLWVRRSTTDANANPVYIQLHDENGAIPPGNVPIVTLGRFWPGDQVWAPIAKVATLGFALGASNTEATFNGSIADFHWSISTLGC